MARVVVLGAGAMGLAAAYRALALGHSVTLLEAAPEPGGMAAHFDLGGLSIERFYHFVCKSDEPTFELMRELGIGDRMRWRPTSMGYFIGGALHPWGDPLSLLRFPHLGCSRSSATALLMFVSTRRDSWEALEHISAASWIERWCGQAVYDRLWRPLFDLKFYEHADNDLRRLDLDAHPPRRPLAPLAAAGGARLHRGRLGDAGPCARARRSRRAAARSASREPARQIRDGGRPRHRRGNRQAAASIRPTP